MSATDPLYLSIMNKKYEITSEGLGLVMSELSKPLSSQDYARGDYSNRVFHDPVRHHIDRVEYEKPTRPSRSYAVPLPYSLS